MRPEFERGRGTGQWHGGPIAAVIDTVGDFALVLMLGRGLPTINLSETPLEGWNRLAKRSFDLVVADVEMPRMNGLEMLSVLRQLPGGQDVPVFMITTRGQERHRKAALSAGVSRYFIKPFDGDDLLAAAGDACRAPLTISIA